MVVGQAMNLELQPVATQVVEQLAAHVQQPLFEPLSERELEVLRLIKTGLTNLGIGEHLFISLNTVRTHTKNINSKLNVNSRTQAIARAKELGIIE